MKLKSDFLGYRLSENTPLKDIRGILESDDIYYGTDFVPITMVTDDNGIKMADSILTFACIYKKEDVLHYILELKSYDEDIEILRIKKPEYYQFIQKVIKKKLLLKS